MKECCKYIEEFKVSENWHEHITIYASMYGHLDCLKYAHEHGCPWSENTTSYAAGDGYLDCLKYAHENGCPWDLFTTSIASYYGNLDCLKYAHKNGCPWGSFTILNAAENDHFDCLKYAHENGCPFNEEHTLSNLEKCISIIDLDNKWWRSFLFDKDLTSHLILKNLIDTKKEEIKNLQEKSTSLFPYISKDLTKYVLWTYF